MPTIEFTPPAEIDGTTEDVLKQTLSQLAAIAPAIQRLTDESMIQVRSSWMSFELGRDPELTPEQLADRWEASELKQATDHVRAAGLLIARSPAKIHRLTARNRG